MDGHGWGEAANDDGSGTALVMELARIFSMPDVVTERDDSLRALEQRRDRTERRARLRRAAAGAAGEGRSAGVGRYPEPSWLGMIQHDMMMFDHGAPRADGTVAPEQRPEADVNIEFQSTARESRRGDEARVLTSIVPTSCTPTDYPAQVGPHMTNTDSTPFMDLVPAISLRENERGVHVGAGWDPHWHQPTDVFATFSDKDFRLGLNAAQTTGGAVAELVGLALRK